jgi:hypothetical protein
MAAWALAWASSVGVRGVDLMNLPVVHINAERPIHDRRVEVIGVRGQLYATGVRPSASGAPFFARAPSDQPADAVTPV